uniref:Uncharacterized protein n=1 Tax=viral metagenome TaxID=1070528 RepID=A0A6C0EXN8_9ZZZZ
MKNMFKSKFSLIAICIILGILIGSFALCGCRTNYGLLEGMEVDKDKKKSQEGADGTVTTTPAAPAAAPAAPAAASSATPLTPASAPASGGGAGLAGMGDMGGANKLLDALKQAGGSANPLAGLMSSMPAANAAPDATKTEGFQVSKPLAWGPLTETEVTDFNLTKWVKDAMRYSKGMGNENRLDSYQYNSGPQIPLPEGEMLFFKDTKFDASCCPGTYSNSLGCACLSKKQFQYLTMRGGNNTVPDNKTSYYNEF